MKMGPELWVYSGCEWGEMTEKNHHNFDGSEIETQETINHGYRHRIEMRFITVALRDYKQVGLINV